MAARSDVSERTTFTTATASESRPNLDALAQQLFRAIQTGFDREIVLKLQHVSGVDEISRVETEMRCLDLFAVYLAIRLSHNALPRHDRATLFEYVCIQVLTWWREAWDTRDEVVEVVKSRFAAYNRILEAVDLADNNEIAHLISIFAALLIQRDRKILSDEGDVAGAAVVNAIEPLLRDDSVITATANQIFANRFAAVSQWLDGI